MNRLDKSVKPLIKNRPIQIGITAVLVLFICFALIIIGSWGNLVVAEAEPGNSPDDVISVPTPDPTPEPTPEPTPGPTPEPDPTPEPTPDPTPEPVLSSLNPLSGLPINDELVNNRPVAVSLSNDPAALPMNGVSSADIIFEFLIEGGWTRMLGVFQDFTQVPKAGSIRSARHYTVEIVESLDAIFIHAGGSPLGYQELRNRGIDNFDEVSGKRSEIYFRDRGRIAGRRLIHLHSLVVTGERYERRLPDYTFRKVLKDGYELGWKFVEDGTPGNGATANNIVVSYSAGKTSTFIYDSNAKTYKMEQKFSSGGRVIPFTDANDNSTPGFTNVIVLKTSVSTLVGEGSGAGRQDIVTIGSGEGYFINGGKYIEIEWSRANKESPFVFKTKDGAILELGEGKSYISIIPRSRTPDFS